MGAHGVLEVFYWYWWIIGDGGAAVHGVVWCA